MLYQVHSGHGRPPWILSRSGRLGVLTALGVLMLVTPARAGHYEIVWEGATGSLNGTSIELDPDAGDLFEEGDCLGASGSFSLTDRYSYTWVPDSTEGPEEEEFVMITNAGWSANETGSWEQECSSTGSASGGETSISSRWYNTIDGQGGGQLFPPDPAGGELSQVIRLNASSGTFEVSWAISTTISGYDPQLSPPYDEYMDLVRKRPQMRYIVVLEARYNERIVDNGFKVNIASSGKWRPYQDQTLSKWRIKLYYLPKDGPGTYYETLTGLSLGTWSDVTTDVLISQQSTNPKVLAVLQYETGPNTWGTPAGQNRLLFESSKVATCDDNL